MKNNDVGGHLTECTELRCITKWALKVFVLHLLTPLPAQNKAGSSFNIRCLQNRCAKQVCVRSKEVGPSFLLVLEICEI